MADSNAEHFIAANSTATELGQFINATSHLGNSTADKYNSPITNC
mgnify:CR=1 FL=1